MLESRLGKIVVFFLNAILSAILTITIINGMGNFLMNNTAAGLLICLVPILWPLFAWLLWRIEKAL